MKETYLYHGHSIDLDLRGRACARVRWTYFIDERYCMQGTMDSVPIETVRSSALALAHRAIDALDSMSSANGDPKSLPPDDACAVFTTTDRGSHRFTEEPAPAASSEALAAGR